MRYLVYVIAGLVLGYLILPVFVIIPMSLNKSSFLLFPPTSFSLKWYAEIAQDSTWLSGCQHSLIVAITTTCISVVIGTCASLALIRLPSKLQSAIYNFVMLPVVVPLIVTAVALYKLYSAIGLTGSLMALVISHVVISVPYVVSTTLSALRSFDMNLERVAQSLGASPVVAVMRITLPLILPGIASGAIFSFITSFDEIIIALFVSNVNTQTLPVVMWNNIRLEINPSIAAVASLVVLFTVAVLLSVMTYQWLRDRRLKRRSERVIGRGFSQVTMKV